MIKAGYQLGHLDTVSVFSAMAAVAKSIALAPTAGTSYVNPHFLAREFSTLDHTEGRVGWTSSLATQKALLRS